MSYKFHNATERAEANAFLDAHKDELKEPKKKRIRVTYTGRDSYLEAMANMNGPVETVDIPELTMVERLDRIARLDKRSRECGLSPRQEQLMQFAALGMHKEQICALMNIAESTEEQMLTNIRRKIA